MATSGGGGPVRPAPGNVALGEGALKAGPRRKIGIAGGSIWAIGRVEENGEFAGCLDMISE